MKVGICENCNENAPVYDRGRHRKNLCQKCFAVFQTERRIAFKVKAIEYLGGKCSKCSYSRVLAVLEFHHINPIEKEFEIGTLLGTSRWDLLQKELDKCILLCSNCHAEEHNSLTITNFKENRIFPDYFFAGINNEI